MILPPFFIDVNHCNDLLSFFIRGKLRIYVFRWAMGGSGEYRIFISDGCVVGDIDPHFRWGCVDDEIARHFRWALPVAGGYRAFIPMGVARRWRISRLQRYIFFLRALKGRYTPPQGEALCIIGDKISMAFSLIPFMKCYEIQPDR